MFTFTYFRGVLLVTTLAAFAFLTSGQAKQFDANTLSQPIRDSHAAEPVYYTIRGDLRKCVSPLCGGYFIKRVNEAQTRCANGRFQSECYVAFIEWQEQAEVEPAKALLLGTLVTKGDRTGNYDVLQVSESWESVSDNQPAGTYYRVKDLGVRCIAAPCETHRETKLNSTFTRNIAGIDLTGSGAPDRLISEAYGALTGDGVLVTGNNAPVSGPAGKSQTLKATKLFLRATAKSGTAQKPCIKTGCSGEVCAEEQKITKCLYRAEYACYKSARCERQANGDCGFTQTTELASCLRRN
jgi:hypothetical protein